MPARKTQEEFIKQAKEVHGDRYDYSRVEYINNNTKVEIICPLHNIFLQYTSSHVKGHGCNLCAIDLKKIKTRKTLTEFINKAREIHGHKYDYSKAIYLGAKSKIEIMCEKHGSFLQNPTNHFEGQGCKLCALQLKTTTQEEFIEKAREIHGNTYDYSKALYSLAGNLVQIICQIHGIFDQKAQSHLKGHGCSECYFNSKVKTQEEFIKQANEVHENRYDYSETIYTGSGDKVYIICKTHGKFHQVAGDHLRKNGCSSCVNKTEGLVNTFLLSLLIDFKIHPQYEWCKKINKLPFDFVIKSCKLIIEIDGDQHFKDIPQWYSTKQKVLETDIYKTKLALKNGYSVLRLIQTEIWDNKYDWKKILKQFIEEPIREVPVMICVAKNMNLYNDHFEYLSHSELIFIEN